MNKSGSGDLIELGPGTYTENVNVSQSVTIQGDLFRCGSTVNGNNAGYVFLVRAGTATLNSLTITNGIFDVGEGILNSSLSATLTVVDCTISGNHAGDGGGIASDAGGTLTVINSTIRGNSLLSAAGYSPADWGHARL